jgi:polyhydroxyalkanoate synthesis regulator phasin
MPDHAKEILKKFEVLEEIGKLLPPQKRYKDLEITPKEFSLRLEKAMRNGKVSHEQLMQLMGWTQEEFNTVLTGQRKLSIPEMEGLYGIFGRAGDGWMVANYGSGPRRRSAPPLKMAEFAKLGKPEPEFSEAEKIVKEVIEKHPEELPEEVADEGEEFLDELISGSTMEVAEKREQEQSMPRIIREDENAMAESFFNFVRDQIEENQKLRAKVEELERRVRMLDDAEAALEMAGEAIQRLRKGATMSESTAGRTPA